MPRMLIKILIIFLGCLIVAYFFISFSKPAEIEESVKIEQLPIKQEKSPEKETVLPESLNLEIPFAVQAPLGDWSPPFDHTCEEATILMVDYLFKKEKADDPIKIKKDLLDLVDFQIKNYGFYQDTSTAQTAQLIRDYYGYEVKVYYDISLEDIKKALAQGNPVILPVAGRLLGNPYFTPPGPINHMIVIKGYNSNGFITNDPGTKRGADFFYSFEVLEKAIRDYGQNSENKKAMIVIYPAK